MPQPNDVALVVDNPKRDLRGTVLTAYQLAKRGCRTAIVPMYAQGYDLPLLAPNVVLLNYIRQSNEELARSYRALGIRLAVMDTEGGILSRKGLREPNTWAGSLRDAGLAVLVDDYFFWGEAVREAFLANSGMLPEQLHLTGCPRYDLCAPPWNAALAYRRSGFVLVNTNFSAINPAFTRSSAAEKQIFRSLGWSDAYISRWFEELEGVFPRYLDEVEAMARAMPQQAVVVRPHPFEDQERYRRRFAGVPNIEVDGSGDVLNMIHEAKCVVHLNCGTSVDALLQRKVPVSLEYLNTELLLDHTPLPSRLSLRPRSREELVEAVKGLVEGRTAFDHDAAFAEIEPWFYRADGAAAERVASVLAALPKGSPRPSLSHAVRGGRAAPSAGQVLQGLASAAFGSHFVGVLRGKVAASRKGKDIPPGDVQSLLDFYAQVSHGPRYRARRARSRLTGLPLSTIEILPE
ncbi:surface carbohydrate biosynthesis protein [Shinella sp. BYT-45]|uniref:surface carbohydrate biosynthesis protein n=1 Tax=Shinella sp. BYT-45 TaxID=3377377 RepID=UPI003980B073